MVLTTKVFSIRSPLAITMILHARAINSPFPHWDSPAQTGIRERFVNEGLTLNGIVYRLRSLGVKSPSGKSNW